MSIRISKNAWVSSALVPSILTATKEPPATVSDARAMAPTDTEPPSGPAGSHEGQRPTLRPEEVSEAPQDTTMAEPPEPEKPAEPLEPEPVKPQAASEKVEDKKEAPKIEAPEKVEDKREAPKMEAPEKVEDKKEAPKIEAPEKVEDKKEEPKIEAPEKVEDKKEAPKIEAPEKVEDKKEAPKIEAPEKVEDKKEAPKIEAPEKVEDKKEAPKTEEQLEPDPKPQIDDEHPLQERVPLSPDHAEPKEEVPGKDPKAEPKAAEKSGKAKPSLFDRMMGFIVGKPSVPPPDPAGAVSFSSVMLWNAFDGHMQSRFPERSSDLSRSIQHDNKTYSFHYTHIPVQL